MSPQNQQKIETRVARAAASALSKSGYVTAIDVLVGMRWLEPVHVQNWRRGRIPYLEQVIHTNLKRVSFAMKAFRKWALRQGLKPSLTVYKGRTRQGRSELRFSKSGKPSIEEFYRTHYVSAEISAKKKERLSQKIGEPPEIVVFSILRPAKCSGCQSRLHKGSFLVKEHDEPWCMECADLDHLVYLPRGDAKLTRRGRKYSPLSAVVVRFSRTRKRYERQGLLVGEAALSRAEEEWLPEAEVAERRLERALERNSDYDHKLVEALAKRVRAELPNCPGESVQAIAEFAARRTGTRLETTARESDLDEELLREALRGWVRAHHTDYDVLRMQGVGRESAREQVSDQVDKILRSWRES